MSVSTVASVRVWVAFHYAAPYALTVRAVGGLILGVLLFLFVGWAQCRAPSHGPPRPTLDPETRALMEACVERYPDDVVASWKCFNP